MYTAARLYTRYNAMNKLVPVMCASTGAARGAVPGALCHLKRPPARRQLHRRYGHGHGITCHEGSIHDKRSVTMTMIVMDADQPTRLLRAGGSGLNTTFGVLEFRGRSLPPSIEPLRIEPLLVEIRSPRGCESLKSCVGKPSRARIRVIIFPPKSHSITAMDCIVSKDFRLFTCR